MRRYINEGLTEFLGRAPVPWHMPGHKRRSELFDGDRDIDIALKALMRIDVTEVPGTDDLYQPEEMILESMKELVRVYGSKASYYMVNGATGGILAAIYAAREYAKYKGTHINNVCDNENSDGGKTADILTGKILVAGNCHKSVFNAVDLLGMEVAFVEPEKYQLNNQGSVEESTKEYSVEENEKVYNEIAAEESEYEGTGIISGHISVERVREICENEHIYAMVLTSPTYEGVVSDIKGIADELHKRGGILVVDEAHGAHLPFADRCGCPASAIKCGADIVVQSLHKTLPAMTQTAVMHVMEEDLKEYIKDGLQIFMSSSPSYVMLCSMENAIAWAQEFDFSSYYNCLRLFRERVKGLRNIHVISSGEMKGAGAFAYDDTRIVITIRAANYPGRLLAEMLRTEYNIVVEMVGVSHVVLISTAADSLEDFDKLAEVLCAIDERLGKVEGGNVRLPEHTELVEVIRALQGSVAESNLYVYPPGSYIVRRGDIITKNNVDELIAYAKAGLHIRGL